MASPQVENGYTPISNELLEAILRTRLSAHESKSLFAVARETFGWSKKAKSLTTARIAHLIAVQPTKAARALRRLKARNILVNGTDGLGIQKDYERWRPAGRSESDLGPKRTRNQVRNGPRTRSETDPYKTRKQENNPPTPPRGDVNGHPAQAWIELLNRLSSRMFKFGEENLKLARARIKAGFTLKDAEAVVRFKVAQWGKDPERQEYLRPATLFGTKFESYLQAAKAASAIPEQSGFDGYNDDTR